MQDSQESVGGNDLRWYFPKGVGEGGFGVQVGHVLGVVLGTDPEYLDSFKRHRLQDLCAASWSA